MRFLPVARFRGEPRRLGDTPVMHDHCCRWQRRRHRPDASPVSVGSSPPLVIEGVTYVAPQRESTLGGLSGGQRGGRADERWGEGGIDDASSMWVTQQASEGCARDQPGAADQDDHHGQHRDLGGRVRDRRIGDVGAGEDCGNEVDGAVADDLLDDCHVARACVASLGDLHQRSTAYSRHSPGMPLSSRVPRSSKAIPEPATRSLTVLETSTSPGCA